jgi:hypothetical protein
LLVDVAKAHTYPQALLVWSIGTFTYSFPNVGFRCSAKECLWRNCRISAYVRNTVHIGCTQEQPRRALRVDLPLSPRRQRMTGIRAHSGRISGRCEAVDPTCSTDSIAPKPRSLIKGRPYERPGSVRKRSSTEGGGGSVAPRAITASDLDRNHVATFRNETLSLRHHFCEMEVGSLRPAYSLYGSCTASHRQEASRNSVTVRIQLWKSSELQRSGRGQAKYRRKACSPR